MSFGGIKILGNLRMGNDSNACLRVDCKVIFYKCLREWEGEE